MTLQLLLVTILLMTSHDVTVRSDAFDLTSLRGRINGECGTQTDLE